MFCRGPLAFSPPTLVTADVGARRNRSWHRLQLCRVDIRTTVLVDDAVVVHDAESQKPVGGLSGLREGFFARPGIDCLRRASVVPISAASSGSQPLARFSPLADIHCSRTALRISSLCSSLEGVLLEEEQAQHVILRLPGAERRAATPARLSCSSTTVPGAHGCTPERTRRSRRIIYQSHSVFVDLIGYYQVFLLD